MEIFATIGFFLFIYVCIRLYLRTSIRYMTPRVADKILESFSPQEWFSHDECVERVKEDEMITAYAIAHLFNEAHMLEYRLNPLADLDESLYQVVIAHVAQNGMKPSLVGFFKFRIVGTGQRPKRSLTDIMRGALEGVLGPKGLPEPA